ncbi:MAG: hypothetical protein L0312_12810, partial [Acidobacteria bacterium]|nr:hypothetical protein [Acidobacteriota bacterium]
PSTGEPIQIGASELPVFIQQRGQDVRALIAERGREARAAAGRAQSESQFQRSQAATESRFQRRAPSGLSVSFDEQGRPIVSTGSQLPRLTESQGKATALALRGTEATDQMSALEDAGYRPGLITQAQQFAGNRLGSKNRFLSEEGQRYEQAALNFGTAIGRFESGAAIPEAEWLRFTQQYMALPGSTDAEIAQKRQNRETAIRGIRIAAGPGRAQIPPLTGELSPSPGAESAVTPGETIQLPNGTTVEFLD